MNHSDELFETIVGVDPLVSLEKSKIRLYCQEKCTNQVEADVDLESLFS
jgi:hypothetical protein